MSNQLTRKYGNCYEMINQQPKYTHKDWSYNNQLKSRISCDQQKLADRVICETERVLDETKETTTKFKKETDYRLEERVSHIAFTVEELKEQKKYGEQELEILKDTKNRIQHSIESIKTDALIICEKCIILRENRTGIDNVDDDVEKGLRKERHVILGSLAILEKLLNETTEQIRKLRASIYFLIRDLSNKENSLQIDQQNLVLRENQIDMKIYEGKMDLDPYNSTVLEWTRETTKNIDMCKQEIKCAMSLRSYVEILFKQVVEDIENQFYRTNETFLSRMEEMRCTKMKLEGLHCGTANQVNELTRNMTKLEKELAEKERYVALSQMRLGNRAQRVGLELCKDRAQDTLMRELMALKDTYQKLSNMIDQSKTTLRYLLNTQMLQEEEINLKINTLKIDMDCMTIRESLKFQEF